jgi:uncharacterized protein YndB with AHSA1/START domain
MPARNKPNEIYITRVYDAPVAAVWDAWTDPAQVAQWWGPRGFTITTHSKDLRVGGHWSYTMHGPDGTNYENKTLYFEVEPQRKLVYDHGGNDDRPPLFRVTVLFTALGGKTQMEMTMALATPEAAAQIAQFIKQAGGNATWDRLAEFLEQEQSGKAKFVINRTFNAPLEVLFEMWTNPQHLAQWLPPSGFTMQFLRADIRPGGGTLFLMSNGAGIEFRGRAQYQSLEKPQRLIYTQQFCDSAENIARHPLAPIWPETMLTTVEFCAESPTQTRVTVTWEPVGNVTPEELAAFIAARAGMTLGWTGSFDKLEDSLPRA